MDVEPSWLQDVFFPGSLHLQVVPAVLGTLGAVPKDLGKHLRTIGVDKITIGQLQKATLLGSAHIIRRYITHEGRREEEGKEGKVGRQNEVRGEGRKERRKEGEKGGRKRREGEDRRKGEKEGRKRKGQGRKEGKGRERRREGGRKRPDPEEEIKYFGHLMRIKDSLEKSLMLGKTENNRRRGRQRMRWMDGVTEAVGVSLNGLQKMEEDKEGWRNIVHGVTMVQYCRLLLLPAGCLQLGSSNLTRLSLPSFQGG
ncbi:Neurofilament light polypeptide, partial [Ophiophagus hannah]